MITSRISSRWKPCCSTSARTSSAPSPDIDALRLLLHNEFALIILDVDMPIMNGFETAALIREREKSRHTPIIFLTAVNKNEQHVFKGYSLGAVDYLTKPFVPEVLRAKVMAFVELHKKTEEVKRQTKLLQQIVSELASSNDEIRKLNVELQAERDFVSTVLDTADSIVVIIDAEQKIVRASRAFERILGYSSHETNGADAFVVLCLGRAVDGPGGGRKLLAGERWLVPPDRVVENPA